jgi:tyrosyl-tRNA synthetase
MHTLGEAVSAVHVLFGDATTRVGDPSDKNGARPVLTKEAIRSNWEGIISCVDAVIGHAVTTHFNGRWLDGMSFMDFLTGPAREISLNRLVATEVVARRLDNQLPMTLMELIYQSMQAMDFAHLAREHGVRLQIGGSDQWTNILAGVDLARRMDGAELFGITLPLLTDAEGRKMGKTAGGQTVWLDPSMTTSFEQWQFWRNVPDEKVEQFLGLLTEMPMDEIRSLCSAGGASINEAKARLATEVVTLVHGAEAAAGAVNAAQTLFGASDDVAILPSQEPPFDPRATEFTMTELMVHVGIADSKAAARRLATQGGFRVNGSVERQIDRNVEADEFDAGGSLILSAGKKRHVRVAVTGPSPLLPIATRLTERPDGLFDVLGTWEWEGPGPVEDCIASGLPDFDAAERRRLRVRTASPKPSRG